MDVLYNLTGVVQIVLEETVTWWEVIGRTSTGFAAYAVGFRKDQLEQASALACEWCRMLAFPTYLIDQFTETPGVCLLTTIDVASGEKREERRERY